MSNNSWCSAFVKLDLLFWRPFDFILPDKNTKFKTLPGAICTVLVFFAVATYAAIKADIIWHRRDYQI